MLGDGAMIKMAHSSVFLSGLGGLGVEIGNILMNIKKCYAYQKHYLRETGLLYNFVYEIIIK